MNEIAEIYLQIGILGLCAVLVVWIAYSHIKDHLKKNTKTDDFVRDKLEELIDKVMEQNTDYQKEFQKMMENMTELKEISNHIPSKEESEKVITVSNKLNVYLTTIIDKTNADRAVIIQYHNGGKGINGQSFMKMSITNEQIKNGNKPAINIVKDQFRSAFSSLVTNVDTNGYSYTLISDELKISDGICHSLLEDLNIKGLFGISIKNEDRPIGILAIGFSKIDNINVDNIKNILESYIKEINLLLNL